MKLLFLLLLLAACNENAQKVPDEEYVLVEFASKLEEEYSKLHPDKTPEAHLKTN